MNKKEYNFHFILTEKMDGEKMIEFLKKEFKSKNLSIIFKNTLGLLKKSNLIEREVIGYCKSHYSFVENKDKRKCKYLILDSDDYRLLKRWCYIFDEFSIGGIVRDIITFLYDGVKKHGIDEFFKYLSDKTNLFVADNRYHKTRKIERTKGIVTMIAGTGDAFLSPRK